MPPKVRWPLTPRVRAAGRATLHANPRIFILCFVPSTYRAFQDIKNVAVLNWYPFTMSTMKPEGKDPMPFDPKSAFPLDNVVYYWDVPYFYYPRTRKEGGVVPRCVVPLVAHLRAPVAVEVTGVIWDGAKATLKPRHALSTLLQPSKE